MAKEQGLPVTKLAIGPAAGNIIVFSSGPPINKEDASHISEEGFCIADKESVGEQVTGFIL